MAYDDLKKALERLPQGLPGGQEAGSCWQIPPQCTDRLQVTHRGTGGPPAEGPG